MPEFEVIKLEIGKLELKPADVLVIRLPRGTDPHTVKAVEDYTRANLPDKVKFMVVSDAIELSVVHPRKDSK
jgi:hypothetical protein